MLIWTVAHIISKMPSPPLLRLGLLLDLLLVNHEAQQHLPVRQFKDLGRARLVGVLKQALQLDRVQLEEVRQLELRRAERLGVGLRGDRDGDGGVRGAFVGTWAHHRQVVVLCRCRQPEEHAEVLLLG